MLSMLVKSKKFLVCLSLSVVVFPFITLAQGTDLNYALSSELAVKTSPTYPRPNEMVSINLSLYTADLNSAVITWYKDGKKMLSGKGEVKYSFKTGAAGKETKIEIDLTLADGTSFSKTLTFNPASVDIIWEANSYVPPFYKGKALHPKQGFLKVVAMPEFVKNGLRISPQNLIYEWSNTVKSYQNESGYGKNTLTLSGSLLGKSEDIRVTVKDPSSNMTVENSIKINPTEPEIVFYENNPYYGHLFNLGLSKNFVLKTEEIQVLAAPYYFTKDTNIKYDWRLNNNSVPNLSGSMTAIFRKPEDKTSGQSSISLQVENPIRVLQQASANLIMSFNKD
jgi:hypothetical protein